jgi:hypothetical protein
MGKFTTTKEAVKRKAHVPTEVNKMGSKAFKLNAREELVATALTTFVTKSYYEGENEIRNRIVNAMNQVDPEFAAKTALYVRREANMRSSSHLMAGELADKVSGKEWGARFYDKIVSRPDDMSEILAYYLGVKRKGKAKKKIINAMKKGFKIRLERLDPYLIDKYKMERRDISLIDLVNLFHPHPTQVNEEAYKRLLKGEALDDLYTSKILEKEKSKAGQTAKTKAEKDEARATAIRDTLDTNLDNTPIMNLLRNLVSIITNTPDKVDQAIEVLTTPAKIYNSKLLPFRFASAYAEVEKLSSGATVSSVKFEKGDKDNAVKKVLAALEMAINLACENIPKLVGNTAILIDHSGSVRGDRGGHSLVSAFSKVKTATIGNLFGCMLMQTQDNVYMGLFGDRLIRVDNIDRKKGILATAKETYDQGAGCGPGTEQGIYDFFNEVIKNGISVNNVVVFSDMVIGQEHWYGTKSGTGSGNFQALFKKFREVNPFANVVSVNIHQTDGTTVFDKTQNVCQVAGWSEKVFDVLNGMNRGYQDIVKEIEKIEL